MCRTYGFTTVTRDRFLRRVADEAKPRDKYLVVTKRNVKTNRHEVSLLVRPSAMPPAKAGWEIAGIKMGKRVRGWSRVGGFLTTTFETNEPETLANTIKNELQRVKNYLIDRVVRVKVDAL